MRADAKAGAHQGEEAAAAVLLHRSGARRRSGSRRPPPAARRRRRLPRVRRAGRRGAWPAPGADRAPPRAAAAGRRRRGSGGANRCGRCALAGTPCLGRRRPEARAARLDRHRRGAFGRGDCARPPRRGGRGVRLAGVRQRQRLGRPAARSAAIRAARARRRVAGLRAGGNRCGVGAANHALRGGRFRGRGRAQNLKVVSSRTRGAAPSLVSLRPSGVCSSPSATPTPVRTPGATP